MRKRPRVRSEPCVHATETPDSCRHPRCTAFGARTALHGHDDRERVEPHEEPVGDHHHLGQALEVEDLQPRAAGVDRLEPPEHPHLGVGAAVADELERGADEHHQLEEVRRRDGDEEGDGLDARVEHEMGPVL